VLQQNFGLCGARESCGQGMCGCCTVVVDGKAVSGCLYLAVLAENSEVQTIESGAYPEIIEAVKLAARKRRNRRKAFLGGS
jgi:carbon-monoxide dehydrogenase small subunit